MGIRQQLHWHPDPALSFAPGPREMLRPEWQRGLREATDRGLLFELQVFPDQYDDAIRLVDGFPDTTFVLLHAGMPHDPSPGAVDAWLQGLARFAARRNVFVKLSGLGTSPGAAASTSGDRSSRRPSTPSVVQPDGAAPVSGRTAAGRDVTTPPAGECRRAAT